jgi:hypothetical protein
MNKHSRIVCIAGAASAALASVTAAAATVVSAATNAKTIPLEAASMIIEYNSSAEDIGIQFFLDSDGWRKVQIFDPNGVEIFNADTGGSILRQGGGTELFLESVEPEIGELPIRRFLRRFPEGAYRFRARDNDGHLLVGSDRFTHDIPAGPVLITPVPVGDAECARRVPLPVLIAWDAVTTSIDSLALDIVGYGVIVENDDVNFDVKFPADVLEMTVPNGLLEPGTDYLFEVLAIEESGNQTITEGCFRTAP